MEEALRLPLIFLSIFLDYQLPLESYLGSNDLCVIRPNNSRFQYRAEKTEDSKRTKINRGD